MAQYISRERRDMSNPNGAAQVEGEEVLGSRLTCTFTIQGLFKNGPPVWGYFLIWDFASEILWIACASNSLPEEFSEAHARTMTAITVFILVNDWGFSHDESFHPSKPFYHFQDIRNRTLHQV